MNPKFNTKILYGKPVSDSLLLNISLRIDILKNAGIVPSLSVILVGNDHASRIYVNTKSKLFKKYGCNSEIINVDDKISENSLIDIIQKLNSDPNCHGILIQLPIPNYINESNIIDAISPYKDVDGFHPYNVGKLLIGDPRFVPCTPNGIIEILKFYNINVSGKNCVIIGRSNIVGKPMYALLTQNFKIGNATVTMCHTKTKDIISFTKKADIIVAAVGVAKFLTSDMVSDGVDIIDVGINRVDDNSTKGYSIVGDVDYNEMIGKVASITPVPGGVGVMTVTMLLNNTIYSAERYINIE